MPDLTPTKPAPGQLVTDQEWPPPVIPTDAPTSPVQQPEQAPQ